MESERQSRICVLLGGGIGAGKSSVAELFVLAGFRHIEADLLAADVLEPGRCEVLSVSKVWPDVVIDGVVDRGALARIVFSESSDLAILESITHPGVLAEIERILEETSDDVVVEVPLTHLEPEGEWIRIAVVADADKRIKRAVQRGGDPEDVKRRVDSQISDDRWVEWADYVVDNSGEWEMTVAAVKSVIREVGE